MWIDLCIFFNLQGDSSDADDSDTLYTLTEKGKKEYLRARRKANPPAKRRRRRVRRAKKTAKRQGRLGVKKEPKEEPQSSHAQVPEASIATNEPKVMEENRPETNSFSNLKHN